MTCFSYTSNTLKAKFDESQVHCHHWEQLYESVWVMQLFDMAKVANGCLEIEV